MSSHSRWPLQLGQMLLLVCLATTMTFGQGAPAGNQTPASPTRTQPPPTPRNQPAAAPAGTPSPAAPAGSQPTPPEAVPAGVQPPADYLIGPNDVLTIVFWREKEMTGDVSVRPDGRISLPLINEIQAAGLTPEQLRANVTEAAGKYIESPTVAVVVKQINSRKVFITGQVAKQGVYPLTAPTTVLQLITLAGGLLEYADEENISVVRSEGGKVTSFRFNYKDVSRRRKLEQNILLKPGDQIIVP